MGHPGVDTWLLPDLLPTEELFAALAARFGLDIAPEYEATALYADSFDWRLYKQGYLLHCSGACWTLCHHDSREVAVEQDGPALHTSCFARDFPRGKLRELLEPVLDIRCLLPLATAQVRSRQIRVLNRDKKTVAQIVIETQRPSTLPGGLAPLKLLRPLPSEARTASLTTDGEHHYRLFRLFGVRGYESEQKGVRRMLAASGVTETVSPWFGFEEVCQAQGRRPLDYSSKFMLELGGGETAREAMTRAYQALLDTITRNIPGVLADYDPEFLHDLRVAIRRTRSGLSLVKRVLPDSVSSRFSREFRRLGGLTGPTRDLDVYLLAYEDCLRRLPPFLQPGLQEFFAELRRKRQGEQKKLAHALRAKKTEAFFDAWQQALKQHDRQTADLADLPVRELADQIIIKRYKRVMRDGRALDAVTPDAEVHGLRIQCKKLRYVLEFFGSLYLGRELQILIRKLKKLQDILGCFNDLSVQQEMLHQSLRSLPAEGQHNFDQAAALGGLLQSLFQEQQSLRTHFAEEFAQFGDQKTATLFYQLFKKRRKPV